MDYHEDHFINLVFDIHSSLQEIQLALSLSRCHSLQDPNYSCTNDIKNAMDSLKSLEENVYVLYSRMIHEHTLRSHGIDTDEPSA